MMQSFVSMVGRRCCGGLWLLDVLQRRSEKRNDFHGIIGNFHWAFSARHHTQHALGDQHLDPMIVFCAYQMMFAIITPALITGAFANRVTFKAYMLFLTFWLIFVYFPFVHMIWGGGILATWGVLDFAGESWCITSPESPLSPPFSMSADARSKIADRIRSRS